MTWVEKIKRGAVTKEIKHEPPAAEVIVTSRVIPAIDVGHYGFINSVVIKDIIGPKEMIVTGIELIPASEVGTKNNARRKAAADRQKGTPASRIACSGSRPAFSSLVRSTTARATRACRSPS